MAYVHDPTFYVCDDCDTRMKTEDALKYHKERKLNNKEIQSETLNVIQKVENQNQNKEKEALYGLKSESRAIDDLKAKMYLAKNIDGLQDSFIPDDVFTSKFVFMMEESMEDETIEEELLKVGPMTKEQYERGMIVSMLPDAVEQKYHIEKIEVTHDNNNKDRRGKDAKYYGLRKCIMNVSHNSQSKNQRQGLNRECPATLNFRLESEKEYHKRDSNEKRMQKEIINKYPLQIRLNFQHNHQIYCHEYTRFG